MIQVDHLFLIPVLLASFVAFLATPLVIKFAWRLGLIDDPKKNPHAKKIHKNAIPRAGGLAIYIAIATAVILFLPLDKHVAGILVGMSILLVMGLLDDRYDIHPVPRLLVQFVAAAIPIATGIGIAFISNPLGAGTIDLSQPQIAIEVLGQTKYVWIISDIFALIWIVTIMNFLNWGAKGVDGQLPGVVAIAAFTIAILSSQFSADITEWQVTILALILAGAYLGFLPWNMYPQKIMPGFSGSNIAGYVLAILAILTTTKVGTLAVVLGVPLIDSGYTVARRVLSGRSPFWGDAGHLHHRLMKNGLTKAQVAYFYWAVTALLGLIALTINAQTKLYTIAGLAIFILGLILWLTYRPKKST